MCVAYVDMCGQLHAVWIKLPLQVRDSNNSRMYKSAYDCGLWDNISAILVLITLKYWAAVKPKMAYQQCQSEHKQVPHNASIKFENAGKSGQKFI